MLRLSEIKIATNGVFLNGEPKQVRIKGVSIDSRSVKKGELFIAIKGEKLDGHDYLREVIQKGVCAVVISRKVDFPDNVPAILVKDTTKALGQIASFYRDQFTIPVIAVTGSSGKTTAKEMIAKVLSARFKVLKNYKSFNNQFGVPLTILKLKKSHEAVILETGTNRPGDIEWLASIARPTVAVFTNIGASHLQRLKSKQGVFEEKINLIRHMKKDGTIIINDDDAYLRKIGQKKCSQKIISYSIRQKSLYQAKNIERRGLKILFDVGQTSFCLNSPAQHNIYNALSAICCGRLFKLSYNNISNKLKSFKLTVGRQKILKIGRTRIIDDTYNANPVSVKSAVETVSALSAKGKKILVLADMLELGTASKALHQEIGEQIAQSAIDVVITTGRFARYINVGLKTKNPRISHFYCSDIEDVHGSLKDLCSKDGDLILVKGSRGMKMERTVEFLTKLFQTT
ncbi:MAG: UDP-N-acetylmuramoyl-tripeptide--D-alanyl-D-alanine ligase [Candidatus Omnitrophica bacterium]|nr:UDP-N-acetylmuramoyl-tripeptide--D-alanyl-D-alanine ligase [Candidatus Omnitrophota bacterium]